MSRNLSKSKMSPKVPNLNKIRKYQTLELIIQVWLIIRFEFKMWMKASHLL